MVWKAKGVGFYETGFVPEPFSIVEPPACSAEKRAELQAMNAQRVTDALDSQGFAYAEGENIWDRYFADPTRPSIQSVLLLRVALSPKRR